MARSTKRAEMSNIASTRFSNDNALELMLSQQEFKRVGDKPSITSDIRSISASRGARPQSRFQSRAPDIAPTSMSTTARPVDLRPWSTGTLTSANSDVRAGKNYLNHVRRWQGLGDWWRSLFGLTSTIPPQEIAALSSGNMPPRLRGIDSCSGCNRRLFQGMVGGKETGTIARLHLDQSARLHRRISRRREPESSLVRLRIYKRLKDANEMFGDISNLDRLCRELLCSRLAEFPCQEYGRLFSSANSRDVCSAKWTADSAEHDAGCSHTARTRRIGDFYNAITILDGKKGNFDLKLFKCGPERGCMEARKLADGEPVH